MKCGALLVCLALGVGFSAANHCTNKICRGGNCRDNNDCERYGERTGKFPTGGDLCSGSKCRCCFPRFKVDCMNMGGMCFTKKCKDVMGNKYKPVVGSAGSCPPFQYCCEHIKEEECTENEGACIQVPNCPNDFFDAGLPCRNLLYKCCVHDGKKICKRNLCMGRCRPKNKCKKNAEVSAKYPPGGSLCKGRKCKCCVPESDETCLNSGGTCRDDCNNPYEAFPGTCGGGKSCCIHKDDKPCNKVDGKCVTGGSCPMDFVNVGAARCRPAYSCCVHYTRFRCALRSGRCFKNNKCGPGYKSAGGSGLCRGRKLKCCV